MTKYPVKLTLDGSSILATFPGFPGATCGADRRSALLMSRDALETVLSAMIDSFQVIPDPREVKPGEPSITLSPEVEIQVELYKEHYSLGS